MNNNTINKNRLLLISPIFVSNKQKGHAPFMQNMLDAYIRNGLSVDTIVKKGRSNNIIHKIWSYSLFYLKILLTNTKKYDFVQISFPTLAYPAFKFKKYGKAKIIIRFHGEDLVIPDSSKIKCILNGFSKKSIQMSNLTVVPSKYFYNIVKKIDSNANIYIYPSGGVDLNKFYPIKSKKSKDNELSIGYVGRLSIEKGLLILIDAIKLVEHNIILHIVGDGPDKEKILKYAKDKKIKFLYHGSVSNDILVEYYNLFEVFVFPTTRLAESFGNVGIEAMACGVPVIGSDIGGITEYLSNDYNGYLFNAGNSNDLANKLKLFISLEQTEKNTLIKNAISTSKKFETNYLTLNFIKYIKELEI